jgi:hypothetical protein
LVLLDGEILPTDQNQRVIQPRGAHGIAHLDRLVVVQIDPLELDTERARQRAEFHLHAHPHL